MLVVVDDALVAGESRVHVQAAALAQPQPHRLAQSQLHQRARGGRVDRLVTERPLVLALVLSCEAALRGPDRERAELAAHRHRLHLYVLDRPARQALARHVEHDARERVVLPVLGVRLEGLVRELGRELVELQHAVEVWLRHRVAKTTRPSRPELCAQVRRAAVLVPTARTSSGPQELLYPGGKSSQHPTEVQVSKYLLTYTS